MTDIGGRVVVVTGGSGFIGKALIKKLLGQSTTVYNLDLVDSAENISLPNSDKFYTFKKMNFLDPSTVENYVKLILDGIPVLSGLVCLAAYNQTLKLENISQEQIAFTNLPTIEWESTFKVNVTSTMLINRAVAEKMKTQGLGSIVNIASIFGVLAPDQRKYGDSGLNSNAAYGASKAAVIQMSKYLAAYYANTGIRVNSISPGGVERNQPNDFIERYANSTTIGRMGTPEDIVGAISYLLSDDSKWTTGINLVIDGGYSAW